MGYVASRKFCCCLPVRFGVFCMALLGLATGGVFSVFGWIEVHKIAIKEVSLDTRGQVALWFITISFSFTALISLFGLLGSLFKIRSFVTSYAYTVAINTLVNITVGIFFVWTLFHHDDGVVDKCVNGADGETGDVKHWFCQKGFGVIRVVITIAFVIIWIFMIAGIFIVSDYVGQLHEEHEMEEDQEEKMRARRQQQTPPPVIVVPNNSTTAPPMRTTYEASPYVDQGGWTSARSPYVFNMSGHAHGNA